MTFLSHIYLMLDWFGHKVHHWLKNFIYYKKSLREAFFLNRNAQTIPLFKNLKNLKFTEKEHSTIIY